MAKMVKLPFGNNLKQTKREGFGSPFLRAWGEFFKKTLDLGLDKEYNKETKKKRKRFFTRKTAQQKNGGV